jgi:hypothetical protein
MAVGINLDRARDVASARLVDASSIRNLADSGQGSVKVGSSTYKVSVESGAATVRADNFLAKLRNFFSPVRVNKLQTLLTDRLHAQQVAAGLVSERQDSKSAAISAALSRASATVRHTSTISEAELAGMESQVAYGFASGRRPIRSVIVNAGGQTQWVNTLTIDKLNANNTIAYIGNQTNYGLLMREYLDPQAVRARALLERTPPEERELSLEWRGFLAERLDCDDGQEHFDIFARVHSYMRELENPGSGGLTPSSQDKLQAKGLDGLIRELLLKNSPSLNEMAVAAKEESLRELTAQVKTLAPLNREARLEIFFTGSLPPDVGVLLSEAGTTHYFRQTSKLGLDFFRSRTPPVPVNFWLQNPDLTTVSSADTLMASGRQARRENSFSEAITYSEMRHALRHNYENVHYLTFYTAPTPAQAPVVN